MTLRESIKHYLDEVYDDSNLDEIADRILALVAEDRRELVEALDPFAEVECECPIKESIFIYDCGMCKTCKARAALAKGGGV